MAALQTQLTAALTSFDALKLDRTSVTGSDAGTLFSSIYPQMNELAFSIRNACDALRRALDQAKSTATTAGL